MLSFIWYVISLWFEILQVAKKKVINMYAMNVALLGRLYMLEDENPHRLTTGLGSWFMEVTLSFVSLQGAFAALVSGVLLGAARFTSDFFFDSPGCGQVDTRPGIIKKLPFLHFALLLFGICLFVIILVSLLTEPMPKEKVQWRREWIGRGKGEKRDEIRDDEIVRIDISHKIRSIDFVVLHSLLLF